jgi:hypothetical protein
VDHCSGITDERVYVARPEYRQPPGACCGSGARLSKQLEDEVDLASPKAIRRLGVLTATEQRSFMLLAALQSVYIASGSFASAALVSIFGAAIVPLGAGDLVRVLEVCAAVAGLVAISALIYGSVMLIRETRIVVQVLQERAASVRARAVSQGDHMA